MSKLSILKKTVKWAVGIFLSLILLISVALSLVVWILTPEQLTPIVLKYANEAVNADVKIDKVELTVWKSFPAVTIDVDGIEVISHALDSLPAVERDKLPQYSDTLVSMERFHGGINLLNLIAGKISVSDIMLISPRINLVAYSPTVANYNIVPPSEDSSSGIPVIDINSIEITKCKGINYFSVQDSLEVNLGINAAQVNQSQKGRIQVLFDAITSVSMGQTKMIYKLPFNINGMLTWDMKNPTKVVLDKWNMKFANTPMTFSVAADFGKEMKINKLDVNVSNIDFTEIKQYLPKEYMAPLKEIKTNLKASFALSLTTPYVIGGKSMPSLKGWFEIPDSYLIGEGGKSIDNFKLKLNGVVDGINLDKSVVTLEEMAINGKSIDIAIKGKAMNIVSNPKISGEIVCDANIAKVIKVFNLPVKYRVNGDIDLDTKFDFSISDIKKKLYQNIGLLGKMRLSNFSFMSKSDSIDVYAHMARFRLGSKDSYKDTVTGKIRNMLRADFSLDSLKVFYKGMDLTLLKGAIGAGAVGNMAHFNDNKHVIPMGAKIDAGKMVFIDVDSTRIRFNNMSCKVSARKFKENSIKTILNLDINAERANYRTKTMRASLKNGVINLEFSPRETKLDLRIDSLRKLYPKLGIDSLTVLARKSRRKRNIVADSISGEKIDLAIDGEAKGLLRKWKLKGSIEAEKARFNTPYFPIKNSISGLDLKFSLDSFIIKSGHYQAGRSSFDLSGGIRNMRSTLMGRNSKPLSIELNINSDTLDVNQLIATTFAGAAYAENAPGAATFSDKNDSDDIVVNESDTVMAAFIIPSNVDVDIDVAAKYGIYTDMRLSDLSGCLRVHDGALQLNDIATSSDAGAIRLNALYAAKDKQNIRFVFDAEMQAIQLDRFIKLIPQVDSIMPLLKSMDGVIRADIAASTRVDSNMNIILPSLAAAMKLHGDSLVLFDSETFSSISKMLRFKNKKRNLIDNMTVELIIKDNTMQLFPFIFYMDRYKVGIMGHNDLNLNLDYHISVLKSPIPFKFGLNITGNVDNLKYRLGKARFKEDKVVEVTSFVDNTRINLREQIDKAFKRGVHAALTSTLKIDGVKMDIANDTLTSEDSLKLINEGLLDAPKKVLSPKEMKELEKQEKKKEKERKKREKEAAKQKKSVALKREKL